MFGLRPNTSAIQDQLSHLNLRHAGKALQTPSPNFSNLQTSSSVSRLHVFVSLVFFRLLQVCIFTSHNHNMNSMQLAKVMESEDTRVKIAIDSSHTTKMAVVIFSLIQGITQGISLIFTVLSDDLSTIWNKIT